MNDITEAADKPFLPWKAEMEDLTSEKERQQEARLAAIDLLYGGNPAAARLQLEALLPDSRALVTRMRRFSGETGLELDDTSWMLKAVLVALLEALARTHGWEGFDALAREADAISASHDDPDTRIRFAVELASIRSGRDGLQVWWICLDEARQHFLAQGDTVTACGYLLDLADLYLWMSDMERAEEALRLAVDQPLPKACPPARTLQDISIELEMLDKDPAYQFPDMPDIMMLSAMTPTERQAVAHALSLAETQANERFAQKAKELAAEAEGIRRWSFLCDLRYRIVMARLRLLFLREAYGEAQALAAEMLADPLLQDVSIHTDILFYHQLFEGLVLVRRGMPEKALTLYSEIFCPGDSPVRARFLLLAQAQALLALEKFRKAFDSLLPPTGFEGMRNASEPAAASMSMLTLLARAAAGCGEETVALQAWGQVVSGIVTGFRTPMGYRMESALIASHERSIREAMQLCVRLHRADLFLQWSEPLKAKSLSAVLQVRGRLAPGGVDGAADGALDGAADGAVGGVADESGAFEETGSVRAAHAEAVHEYDTLGAALDRLDFDLWSGRLPGEMANRIRQERLSLLKRRERCFERIRVADPRWRLLTGSGNVQEKVLCRHLSKRRQALLILYLCGRECLVAVADGSGMDIGTIDLSPVWDRLSLYVENLSSPEANPVLYDPSAGLFLEASHLIPGNLLERALQAESLVVCPHRALHLVPWPVLLHRGKRLFQRLPVGVMPSANACLLSPEVEHSCRQGAFFGVPSYQALEGFNPLMEGQHEINCLNERYHRAGRLLQPACSGMDATEAALVGMIRASGEADALLHVVCHGMTDPEDPMRSGLILTDSVLDAGEIARIYPCPREVVLSACSTGFRPLQAGEFQLVADEVLGLPGAFMEAGAQSLLTSIPPANDKTASRFMLQYHDHRLASLSPLTAFCETQRVMLAQGEPVYRWAGFLLYGCS